MKLRYLIVFTLLLIATQSATNLPVVFAITDDIQNPSVPPTIPSEIIGVWKGTGTQIDQTNSWSILISLHNGDNGSIVGTFTPHFKAGSWIW